MARRSRRGSGHIYRRGKIYWFKFFDVQGRPHWRSSGSRDRSIAETMLRDQLSQRDRGTPVLPDPRRVSIDALLQSLLAEYRLNARRSQERAGLSCRHLLRFFEGRAAVSVTGADVSRYADLRRQAKAAPATINRELAALRRAYRLAIRQGVLATMPPITTLREDNVRTGFFDRNQVDTVCRHLSEERAAAVRFCYITGWRSYSEVFPLRWSQVDLKGGFVRLEPGTTKNREGRVFPLTPELRALLEQRLEYTRRCERAQDQIHPRRLPPQGAAAQIHAAVVDDGLQGRRGAWPAAPRPAPECGAQPRARGRAALGCDEDDWPQDGVRVPALRDRQRVGSSGGCGEARRRAGRTVTVSALYGDSRRSDRPGNS